MPLSLEQALCTIWVSWKENIIGETILRKMEFGSVSQLHESNRFCRLLAIITCCWRGREG